MGTAHRLAFIGAIAMTALGITASADAACSQIQVEFLCDVADQGAPWVPASVSMLARFDAEQRSSDRFINGPGYKCGEPRPW